MATFFDSLNPESQENFLRRFPISMEHRVFLAPNEALGINYHYPTHHYVVVLIDGNGRWKLMNGSSIKKPGELRYAERSPYRLLIRAEDLRSKSRLPRRDGYYYPQRRHPLLREHILKYTQVDDFAAKEYKGNVLPRITKVKGNITY